jgi:hypothetical protein
MSLTPAAPLTRKRVAKGPKRPQYLQSTDLDRLMMMLTALVGEVASLRDRVDTHEALAEAGQVATQAAIEAYSLPQERQAVREARREAMLKRVYRVLMEEVDAVREDAHDRDLEQVLQTENAPDDEGKGRLHADAA